MKKKAQLKRAVVGQFNNGNKGEGTPIEVPEPQYQLPPEDMHPARLVWIVDIGTHASNFPDGKNQRKVIFRYELPNEKATFVMERGEEPFLVSKIYTMSLGERSNLYKDIVAWKGKGTIDRVRSNLGLLLGEPCMLNVIHKTTKKNQLRAHIIGVNPLPKATRVPAQITPSVQYSIKDGMNDTFDRFPEWIQELISTSNEIGGNRPPVADIIERNVREATENALTDSRPHRPVGMSEATSVEEEEIP